MDTIETVQQINHHFKNQVGPFEDVTFPEERLLEELPHNSIEDKAILVSMFATFDYNRNASQLVNNIIQLYYVEKQAFDAREVGFAESEPATAEIFEEVGFRYPNRDAHAWTENCRILREKYNCKWSELLLKTGCDAPSLVEQLRDDDFLCIKGVKIAPMYARIVNDEVAPLDNLWELEIPVDTWVRKITQEIFQEDMTDDQIRERWRKVSKESNISRHVVDGAIWQIGNNLDDWGEDYLKDVTES